MASEGTDATRVAIEFLTLWMEDDRRGAAEHITNVLGPQPEPVAAAIAGLLNLNMHALFALAKARGAEPDDIRAWAGDYLKHLSPDLPRLYPDDQAT